MPRSPAKSLADLPPIPPPSSKAKDYSDRPSEVIDELDAVRNRGVARLLNRHFAETTRKLAAEKAEADAALRDLEERRARTKKFVPSGGGELNPYDQLYVELQHKRAECRRKEKETMLLYQRYVHQFGNTGEVVVPKVDKMVPVEPEVPTTSPSTESPVSAAASPPPPSPTPPKASKPEPAALKEEYESALQPDINFGNFYRKKLAEKLAEKDAAKVESTNDEQENQQEVKAPSSFSAMLKTELEAERDVGISEEETADVGISEEETADVGISEEETADVGISEEETAGVPEEGVQETKSTRSQREEVGNAKEPEEDLSETEKKSAHDNVDPDFCGDTNDLPDTTPASVAELQKESPPENNEEEQQTRVEEQNVPQAAAVETNLEQATTISRKSSECSENRPTKEVLTEMPSATTATSATEDDEDEDIRSIISGLTSVNSAVTRQVLDEVETQLESFIKNETEAIRKIMDADEDTSFENTNSSGSLLGNNSQKVALEAEAMARQMQAILTNFESGESAAQVAKTKEVKSEKKSQRKGYPKKFQTSNPTEEWFVHYDETYEREYYHEVHSNRTQWEPPLVEDIDAREAFSHSDVMPDEFQGPSSKSRRSMSRRDVYRRRLRRRRMRRFSLVALLAGIFVASGLYCKHHYPSASLEEGVKLIRNDLEKTYASSVRFMEDQIDVVTGRRARTEAERAQREAKQAELAKVAELKRIEAERKAKEEAKRQDKIAASLRAKEEAHKREVEEKKRAVLKVLVRRVAEVEEERKARELRALQEAMKRPWGCNLPLSYILHGRCRRLARMNPIYNESDLSGSFLQ